MNTVEMKKELNLGLEFTAQAKIPRTRKGAWEAFYASLVEGHGHGWAKTRNKKFSNLIRKNKVGPFVIDSRPNRGEILVHYIGEEEPRWVGLTDRFKEVSHSDIWRVDIPTLSTWLWAANPDLRARQVIAFENKGNISYKEFAVMDDDEFMEAIIKAKEEGVWLYNPALAKKEPKRMELKFIAEAIETYKTHGHIKTVVLRYKIAKEEFAEHTRHESNKLLYDYIVKMLV